ncbi:TSUP family transporter [Helicobacter saguini]|uniref:Probable membrane transporter protein n=1 Tax=Helicobacter saguini TaxID=1548018 RepID=A0A347VPT0_9HELI|nr:TSUP family transporter [Helicobacter saguini]MWV61229.1 TSUP family transporter [Helicobacter saguini]MWV68104.1 TSUP family transporter [Helicobacter saguini]MWV70432.1 TSUP family transporter [Helicobacter saguini]MWV72333.1 TSUP family transporter [Helicobacter saguini]TLD92984.1 hypothetical protein LS64_009320 [Helicobacter saguini]
MDLTLDIYLILFCTAFVAGFVDSIAGGGGIITIPALFLAGIPPHIALGTNKLQGTFGSFSASLHFYRMGVLDLRANAPFIVCVFALAACGTLLINVFDSTILAKFIPFLLIIFAIYFLFSPKIKEQDSKTRIPNALLAAILGIIGFYDGFFGPGTGSFLMAALILLGGFGVTQSLARAKILNFTSNIASLLIFSIFGNILWILGLVMGVGQFIGAYFGAKLASKHGIKIIKPLIVIMSIAISARLLYREYF